MQILPIDLTSLISAILGISIVLIPVIGLTIRFALKPTVETLSRFFDHRGLDETVSILERRMALMEQQIESMEHTVHRLAEVTEFHRALESGSPADPTPAREPGTSEGEE
ncbi:MAG: hypothetical protein PVJ02_00565 [Gemmatimonadota bacterium]|jgi:hypothetical protein